MDKHEQARDALTESERYYLISLEHLESAKENELASKVTSRHTFANSIEWHEPGVARLAMEYMSDEDRKVAEFIMAADELDLVPEDSTSVVNAFDSVEGPIL